MTSVLKEGEDTQKLSHPEGRTPCEDGGKDWSDPPTNQEMPRFAGNARIWREG